MSQFWKMLLMIAGVVVAGVMLILFTMAMAASVHAQTAVSKIGSEHEAMAEIVSELREENTKLRTRLAVAEDDNKKLGVEMRRLGLNNKDVLGALRKASIRSSELAEALEKAVEVLKKVEAKGPAGKE